MRRTPSAADNRYDATVVIARVSAEHGSAPVRSGRRRRLDDRATPDRSRSLSRRLAPLAVGAAAMLVATMVATFVAPSDESADAPELSTLLAAEPTPAPTTPPTTPPATTLPPPPPPPTTPSAPPKPVRPPKPETPKKVAPRLGDGVQAAVARGWRLIGGDEFNGGMSDMWGPYNGAGHAGNGRRTPDAISVENGLLVIRGDSAGNSGGMAWKEGRRYGKWEMRAKFPKGDSQYHPVLILWPTDVAWPQGGEIDFAETTSASDKVSFFLHYGKSNSQKYAHKNIDITQWHNYAVEWTPNAVIGYIDGEKWFESTDPATLPPGKMHPTIQLDYFPDGGSPRPTEMYVDWMRVYG